MVLYKEIIEAIDVNLIYCLIPIIITLMLVELFFKNRFETKKALNLVRWTIILYTIITWISALASSPLYLDLIWVNRVTGPYKTAYWTMLVSGFILPFSLLLKKTAAKFWYVLLVAFCMKIGAYFETFVIIATSFDRDFLPENGNHEYASSILYAIGRVFLQGITLAILLLGIFEMLKIQKAAAKGMCEK